MNKFKFLIAGFMSLVLGATVAVGAANLDVFKEIADVKAEGETSDDFFRLYVNLPWSNIRSGSVKANGNVLVASSSDESKYDSNFGNYVVDIQTSSPWSSIPFEFIQDGDDKGYWYANTKNTYGDYALKLNEGSFTPGYVYVVDNINWNSNPGGTRDNITIKLFSYNVNGTKLLDAPIEYNVIAEVTDDVSDCSYKGYLFMKPNTNWKTDNAWFAAYFFGNGDTWVRMMDDNNDGVYEVLVPTSKSYPNVIFCRMNPGNSNLDWGAKWNQTGDLEIPTNGNNCFEISGWGDGTWSKIAPTKSDITNYFHLYNATDNFGYLWKSQQATSDTVNVYKNSSTGSTLMVLSVFAPVQLDTMIFANTIRFSTETKEESSHITLDDCNNNIWGATIVSKIYDVTTAEKDPDSKDKTLAYTFLKKFHDELGRDGDNVCRAVVNNMDLYYECAAIYNSFDHATYVDSINDAVYEGKQKTIKDTMDWLSNKFGTEPGEGVSAKQNILFINKNIGDSNIIIVALVAVSLIGIAALVIAKRKRLQK